VAMASLFVHLSNILVDQGMSSALVQRKDIGERDPDTAFWLNVVFGLLICGIGTLASPLIALMFKEPRLQPVIVGLSLNFPLLALSSVQDALLRRTFKFKTLAIRSVCAALVGGIAGVVLAFRGFGAL